MITEEIVPSKISNLIKRQFPEWYLQQGPLFVQFVEAYYQWLESPNNPLYYSRHIYDIKDIDHTFDEFTIFFKEKYLKNIQLDTKSDVRTIVKHALDIYRSKGTQRSVKLLFQLVFKEDVKFYYPSTDLFQLSDGEFIRPEYLELLLNAFGEIDNIAILNKEIVGLKSGATAFVDSVARRYVKGRLHDVAYISARVGNFQVGETIEPTDGTLDVIKSPVIVGSLTGVTLNVSGVGEGFEIGDAVSLSSQYGEGARGVVISTVEQFGTADATMTDGGYGYRGRASITANSTVDTIYISNTMFDISNLQITVPGTIQYFQQFDVFSQFQVGYNYNSANGLFLINDDIYTYHANNLLKGHGIVLSKNQINATSGTLHVGVVSGNLNQQLFFTTANVVVANQDASNGFFIANATGKFVANDEWVMASTNNTVGAFEVGEHVFQTTSQGVIEEVDLINNLLRIGNVHGIFYPNNSVIGLATGATANVTAIKIGVGASNTSGTFYNFTGNQLICNNISGTISKVELGSGFAISVSNSLLFSEAVLINNDLLTDYLTTNINAVSYGFPANTSANLTSVLIANALSFTNTTIGKISEAFVTSPGDDYTKVPFIVLDAPPTRPLQYHNYWMTLIGAGAFVAGDIVSQTATNARGMVLQANSSFMQVQNLRFYQNNRFIVTSNSTTTISSAAGAVANVVTVDYDDQADVMGHNFKMEGEFVTGIGAVTEIKVTDSGFGFLDGEAVFINGNTSSTGIANVINQGIGTGYYRSKGGFPSDQKKLFDGIFWQNYSYQLISSLTMDKYEKMLKQITHPAGTIMFGQLQHLRASNVAIGVESAIVNWHRLLPANGVYALSGKVATLSKGRPLVAANGVYSLSGKAAAFKRTYAVISTGGVYSLAGQAATLTKGRKLAAANGVYSVAGQTAARVHGYTLTAVQGTYTLSGQAAILRHKHCLYAGYATYFILGWPANLVKAP